MQVAVQYYRSHGGEGFVVNETFELVDKVADCKSLFDELEGTLSATWDIMFEQAKKYYDENGNLDVPKRYFTPEGYALGSWLMTQRRVYKGEVNGNLTQVQIDRLNSIGMRWESASDIAWERYYASAQTYYNEHGDLNVPSNYVDDEGVKLGQWICGLRSNRNGTAKNVKPLTDEQIARLDAIGMRWGSKYDRQWDEAFDALCSYYNKHRTFDIPVSYKTDSGIALGKWIRRQRDYYANGKLTDERIEKLKSIGFTLEKSDSWEKKYELAKKYYDEHSSLRMSGKTVVNGVWLWKWLNEQRNIGLGKRKNKSLSVEQRVKLERIGMSL